MVKIVFARTLTSPFIDGLKTFGTNVNIKKKDCRVEELRSCTKDVFRRSSRSMVKIGKYYGFSCSTILPTY